MSNTVLWGLLEAVVTYPRAKSAGLMDEDIAMLAFRILLVTITTLLLLAAPGTTLAADIPTNGTHAAIGANYSGWAYVRSENNAATVNVWKWTATGWQTARFDTGASVWLAPWGSGWVWAWRDGSWFAMLDTHAARWTCDTVNGDQTVFAKVPGANLAVKRYNTPLATNAGTADRYDRVTVLCGNGFLDAAGGNTLYALVRVQSYAFCQTYTWDCVLNPTLRSNFTGYINAFQLTDLMNLPPDGEFGQLPGTQAAAAPAALAVEDAPDAVN